MKKHYLKSLLFGVLITASTGTFVSCSYGDDIDDLNNRVTVVEGLIGELKSAIAMGASVTDVTTDDNGVKTIVLSNGSSIKLSAGVKIVETEESVVITLEGVDYVLPKGAAAASLLYRPRYNDGKEIITGMAPLPVDFLVSGGTVTADQLKSAKIEIVDAYALQTRAASNIFYAVEGSASLNGDVLTVSIKPNEGAEAGKTYNANLRVTIGSKEFVSNYFQVEVAESFIYDNAAPQEQIDAVKAKGNAETVDENGSKVFKFNDALASMEGEIDFAAYFEGLPAGAKFLVGTQTSDEGKNAYDALRNSLEKNGKFSWKQRPGTAFPNGFRITVQNAEDQTLVKADFKYNDPLADVDFYNNGLPLDAQGNGTIFEAEMGNDAEYTLELGKNTVDVQKAFMNYETMIPIRHGGSDAWFQAWAKYKVVDAQGNELIINNGNVLEATEAAKKYASVSRGIRWFFRGLSIRVPGANFPDGWLDKNGNKHDPNEDAGFDQWRGDHNEFCSKTPEEFYGDWLRWGLSVDEKNGKFSTSADYTGWGMRIAFSAAFEYNYGVKPLCAKGCDQFGMLFFNRRKAPEGVQMPELPL